MSWSHWKWFSQRNHLKSLGHITHIALVQHIISLKEVLRCIQPGSSLWIQGRKTTSTRTCNKKYPVHIVDGSDGRKDPMQAIYTHLPNAPFDIFYDFACQLEEYCLNRESEYLKNTRFFHDAFHGFSQITLIPTKHCPHWVRTPSNSTRQLWSSLTLSCRTLWTPANRCRKLISHSWCSS